MESIVLSFIQLVSCVPYWLVIVLAVVLGVLDFCYADKCGYGAFCKITFDYRILSDPKKAEKLQSTMQMLAISALIAPLFMLVLYEEYNIFFVLMWWGSFYAVTILTQWLLLIFVLIQVMFTETFCRH